MDFFTLARINMVKNQILPSNVTSPALIDVMIEVPRHIFMPEEKQNIAYIDSNLFISHNRYILPPMIFAKMVEALDIKPSDNCLDIACGSGYSSVILAKLCKKIVAVEADSDLASKAHLNINKLGVDNVIIISDLLTQGHKESAPYDIIFINGSVKEVPESLFKQLADGGRLVTIINKTANSGSIIIYKNLNNSIISMEIFDVSLPIIEDF